ncbi:MAG: transketolase [Clostridium sp.]|jgi:transketolase
MSLSIETTKYLNNLCRKFRIDLIQMLHKAQTGHPGGSLSATEIITTLYFKKMRVFPKDPSNPDRDRFILSKGHAAPMLYLALAEKGFFSKEELKGFRQMGSILQGHPCEKETPGIDLSTGPLGLGVSAAAGMAIGNKLKNINSYVYVLMGDGELQEGIVWEAAMAASKFKLNNMIVILDNNGVQLDGTVDEIMPMLDITKKWEAFGWNVINIDGHDVDQISEAIDIAKQSIDKPTIIIAKTVKGKGISFMEGKNIWHGKPINNEEYEKAMAELEEDEK